MFILDTNHIVYFARKSGAEYQHLSTRMRQFPQTAFYWSIISFHEQLLGWHSYLQNAKKMPGLIHAYGMFERMIQDYGRQQILPFDQSAANCNMQLVGQRVQIGAMDRRIAAIALANNFILLTQNFVDFQKVPGLKFEDWTIP
jgi:tRNA(fMet)-specific endonuclease VapC